jgi:PKD repeat protein
MKNVYMALCSLLMITTVFAQNDTLYSEDFESGGGSFTLNTTDVASTVAGTNHWVLNNAYTGGSGSLICLGFPFSFTVNSTPAQPAGVTNSPNSTYLHTLNDDAIANNIFCSSYAAADGICFLDENIFSKMNSDVNTTGYSNVTLSFWWNCGGGQNIYGEVYYSVDGGTSWTAITIPISQYKNQSTWVQQTISLPAFDGQSTLRFGYRFVDATSNSAVDPGFSLDDIVIEGCPLPVASFSSTTNSLTADFTDASTNNPTSWLWDFGDGNTSTQQNPSHTYANDGTYTVCVTATNSCGSDSSCQTVNVCQFPTPAFTFNTNGLSSSFTDGSSNPTSWLWDFGDGNTSTQQDPTHVYANAGTYTVCLTVTNACGSDSSCQSVTICPFPTPAFTFNTNGLSTAFTDASTGPTSWFWDFGDGNTSTQQDPTHIYANAGTYTVCLTVTNACGSDSTCQSVTICPFPIPSFTSNTSGLSAAFSDGSTGPTSWFWDFGDGNTSTQQDPTHIYANAGTYTVCLTVTNACGSDSSCNTVTVCDLPIAGFSSNSTGLSSSFTDSSTGGTSWLWDFGDGNTSTQQNPTHAYANAGTYTVCLITSDNCGADTLCQTVTVCAFPVASYSYIDNSNVIDFTDGSSSGNSWFWDFGDGNNSTQQNPQHTYASDGTYAVCLTVTDTCGTDSTCQSITVIGTGLNPNSAEQQFLLYPNPNNGAFNLETPYGLNLQLSVVDGVGRLVYQTKFVSETVNPIDLSNFDQGIYLLQVSDGNSSVTKRLMITK